MAQKSGKTTVRRIKATDDTPKKPATKAPAKSHEAAPKPNRQVEVAGETRSKNPLKALGNYFKGAWHELKQVRWPTRANTWSLTGAVLLFTLIFVILIILLDAGFSWVFERLLK